LPRADPRYLTEELANDTARRRKAHVPDNVKFQGSKPNPGLRWIRSRRSRGGDGARRRAEGSRLWIRRRVPRRDHGHGLALCGRHAVDYSGWSKGNGTIAAQALEERARSQASRVRRDAFQKVPAIPTWTRIAGAFNFTTCIEIDRFGPAPLSNPVARFNRDTLVHFRRERQLSPLQRRSRHSATAITDRQVSTLSGHSIGNRSVDRACRGARRSRRSVRGSGRMACHREAG
jgi:hypothetical protein